MLQQIVDLRDERDALLELLHTLADSDWDRPTQFKAWTVNDVMQHLHVGDQLAWASANGADAFNALIGDMRAKREAGLSRVAETRQRLGGLCGAALAEAWRDLLGRLCEKLADRDPSSRLAWAGPSMSLRMFVTARQMEIWAHGQAIYDLVGRDRTAAPRLRNIAEIGVRTFGWTFTNRRQEVPLPAPRVRLHALDGQIWEWNAETTSDAVTGDAVEFCQVVTQTRNVADTKLEVTGDVARRWLAIAQCFAGPPEDPPPPGTRFRAPRTIS